MLAREGTHGPVVHDGCALARAAGVTRGARVTDMRALVPGLQVEPANPEADAADLGMLARWARRWCPWSRAEGDNGVLLDTTGSAHLHGGEAAMLHDMESRLAGLGLTARLGLAPTIGAAWALARHAAGPGRPALCAPDTLEPALADLPVAALRLEPATVLLLRRLGLRTVGALAAVPPEALGRRFRRPADPFSNPPLRLAQAMGQVAEPLVSPRLVPRARVLRRLAEPLGEGSDLMQVLADLLGDLCTELEARGTGARALGFAAFGVDGTVQWAGARTGRPSRDPGHLLRLFEGRLDHINPGFGIEAAALEARGAEPLAPGQVDFSGAGEDNEALACLLDRLAMRLGTERVLQPVARASHLPERSEALVPATGIPDAGGAASLAHPRAVARTAATPLRLLAPPEEAEVVHAVPDGPPARFRWRGQLRDVARSSGPERIAPEWWRERSTVRLRDYYHLEDSAGMRFWLFREGVAGDGRGGAPRWFVHGLDA